MNEISVRRFYVGTVNINEFFRILKTRSDINRKGNLFLLITMMTLILLWILMPLFDIRNGIRSFPFKLW